MENKNENISETIYIHIKKQVENLAETLGEIAVEHIQQEILRQGRIATYELYNSIAYRVNRIMNDVIVSVFSSVPYAIYLNRGTRPHMPPVEKIHEWIIAKRQSVGFIIYEGTVESVAWAIAKTIQQKGSSATRFFELGIESAIPVMNQKIKEMEL